ncbi:MAG: hypothetical protein BWY90_01460 [Deltaproteobacteria bacterium ADurb.BinA014]|nr:MAG: hypothetical protein BWY90_01460 [Deltaproteobacteria bacterium ADurb.BinA014]
MRFIELQFVAGGHKFSRRDAVSVKRTKKGSSHAAALNDERHFSRLCRNIAEETEGHHHFDVKIYCPHTVGADNLHAVFIGDLRNFFFQCFFLPGIFAETA